MILGDAFAERCSMPELFGLISSSLNGRHREQPHKTPAHVVTPLCRRATVIRVLILVLPMFAGPALANNAGQQNTAAAESHAHFQYTNRLITSRDPYLLLHAHNPVEWYPWGGEALAKAKRENRPIFISIGYSTCYWCHVAERTIYSNHEIAKLMNQWFVNIKVDREQLPDVDRVYMLATELMTGQGGWPNNVFLTPDLKPFFAGSYIPPDDFTNILRKVHQIWMSDPGRISASADRVFSAMQRSQIEEAGAKQNPLAPSAWMAHAEASFMSRLDPQYGGFLSDGGLKFPQEPAVELMLVDYSTHRDPRVRQWVVSTLDAMAYGGIWDHVGNGFHRYSTEPTWSIPHFEKMLHDNAQLLQIYAEAYRETSLPLYRQLATGIGDYLGHQMMMPDGGFFTAQDSEVDGIEGASYVWTYKQIESVLGAKDAARFFQIYELTPMPRSGPGQAPGDEAAGVIRVRLPIADALKRTGSKDVPAMLLALAPLRQRLLTARNRRPQPARDEKIVVGLNGLAIGALALSSRILNQPEYVSWARRAAERIWILAWDQKTGALQHEIFGGHAQTPGYLDDYALLGDGFIAMYEVTREPIWKQRAMSLAVSMLTRFRRENGAFASSQKNDLLMPVEDNEDDVYPSGTSAAIDLLLRLGWAARDARYGAAASRALRHLTSQLHEHPESWPAAVAAANLHPPTRTTLASNSGELAAKAAGDAAPNPRFHVPDTADHVHAAAAISPDKDEIEITLKIDEGYHVNANPASLDYLIPTSVSFEQLSPIGVRYPKPLSYTPAFAGRGLNVYDGVVNITATFHQGSIRKARTVRGNVIAQACNDQICLPPANLPIAANPE
jgi:uncharacterized protein YyaL (SSP411 family)